MSLIIKALYTARDCARVSKDKDMLNLTIFLIGELERLDKKKQNDVSLISILTKALENETLMLQYRPLIGQYNIDVINSFLALAPRKLSDVEMKEVATSATFLSVKELMTFASTYAEVNNVLIDKAKLKTIWEAL
jgi:hypothetical protein